MSANINAHVHQAITDYLDMLPAPRYALCVTGEWGSGKTYLLKQQIAKLESSGRPVAYVSLNGVSNTKQIDDALLDQFFPVLRNKNLKVASRLLTGVVKGVLKVDIEKVFDVDSKAIDGSLDLSTPTSKLEEFLSKTNDSILFFDDIERSKLSIEEVLGYINYFVEHTGQKVILGCAENQIPDKPAYLKNKEKVVGISLPVKACARDALKTFLDEVRDRSKNLLQANFPIILKIFNEAGYNNLRVLRQTCLRFEFVAKHLDETQAQNTAFVIDLIGNYFPLAMEIFSEKLGDANIKELYEISAIVSRMQASRNTTSTSDPSEQVQGKFNVSIFTKYSTLSHSSVGWTSESISPIWIDFFVYGAIDHSHFSEAISAHQAFYDENTPSWKRLWYWGSGNVTQLDFEKYLSDVLTRIDDKEYQTIVEVVHAWCIVLGIQDKGCWPFSRNVDVQKYRVEDGVAYIEQRMIDDNFLSEDLIRQNFDGGDLLDSGLGGLGVHGASHGKPKSHYFLAISKAFEDGHKTLQDKYKISLKNEFIAVLKRDRYQINDYLEKLQSSPYIQLFEEIDFDILIQEFETGNALIYANLYDFIRRALKAGVIQKDNSVVQENFKKLSTAISTKLSIAKESQLIIAIPLRDLLKLVDRDLGITPESSGSV